MIISYYSYVQGVTLIWRAGFNSDIISSKKLADSIKRKENDENLKRTSNTNVANT